MQYTRRNSATAPAQASAFGVQLVQCALKTRREPSRSVAVHEPFARGTRRRLRGCSHDGLGSASVPAADGRARTLHAATQGTLNESIARRAPKALAGTFSCRYVICHERSVFLRAGLSLASADYGFLGRLELMPDAGSSGKEGVPVRLSRRLRFTPSF